MDENMADVGAVGMKDDATYEHRAALMMAHRSSECPKGHKDNPRQQKKPSEKPLKLPKLRLQWRFHFA